LRSALGEWWSKDLTRVPSASLPVLVCQVYGGNLRDALPILVAWRLLCLAAKLFDDVEDGDVHLALPEQINTATSLLFLAQLALGKLSAVGLPADKFGQIMNRLNQAGLMACSGQYLDLLRKNERVPVDPDGWLEVAKAKSGHPFAWAAWAGGVVAGAGEVDLHALWEYGLCLGVLRQVTDDEQDFWNGEQLGNSPNPLSTLSLCYTAWVLQGSERDSLIELMKRVTQKDLEADMQLRGLVESAGARQFANAVAGTQVNQAQNALQRTSHSQEKLRPLRHLLEEMSCLSYHAPQKSP